VNDSLTSTNEVITMSIINDDQPANAINSLPEFGPAEVRAYIQGAVYCWCKNMPGQIFAVRDLFGGDNADWNRTPLQVIYYYWSSSYREQYPELSDDELHEKAAEQASKDVGWLMKSVLQDDRREFESCDVGKAKGYKWVDGN